ncbi:MAG: PAS domain S-box protein [Chloroflexota bacterium]|nr:PAS domain S-box protein [Chloroflexota bacterium]
MEAGYLDARFAVAERRVGRLAANPGPEVDHRALVERAPVVTYVTSIDPPGVPLYVSSRIEVLTGYTPEAWLADPGLWLALLDPEDQPRVLAERRRTNASGKPFRAEYRLRRPDGRVVWVRDEAVVVRDEAGATRYYHGVVVDVTERQAAAAALRRSEARFRSLVRNALDVITVLEANGTIRYESPAVERVLGFAPTELIGRNALALVHPDDLAYVEGVFADTVRRPRAQTALTFRFSHADGSWRWLEAVGTNLLDDPNLRGLVVNSRDVTAAREADAALRASDERLRLALENVGMGTWEWDVASRAVVWSEHLGPLYGLPRGTSDLSSEEFFALVHPEDRDRVREADARAIEEGSDYQAEFRVVWADGTERWLEGRGRATARDERGRATRILGVTMDVTARKEAEEALRASERRSRALFASARRQAQELALLHEVRTALARELDLPTVFRVVVEATARSFGYDLVSLYLVEDWRLVLQHQVGYHRVLDRIPISQGVMGRVARTGQPALVVDGRADPDFLAAFEGIVSEVCVPLRDEGRVVGVLNVERTGGQVPEEADLRLMLALAEHVSVAVGRARLYAEVRASEARFRGAFDQAPIGMALVGTDGRWLRVNRALCAMLGYAEADLLATTSQAVTHPDDLALDLEQARRLLVGEVDTYAIEKRYLHRQGHAIRAQLNASLVRDDEGRPRYVVAQIQDVTERKTFEDRLEHLALHDPLTGLPNRVLFADRLERAVTAPRGRGAGPAVLFVDLDRFKLVNDTLGHETGDRLLAAVAERLAAVFRPIDTVARLGGDEFAVLLEGATAAAAGRAAERVIEALRPPFVVDGRETFVSASVGIALGSGRGRGGGGVPPRPQDLLREADIALYQAKAAGRGTSARFDPRMAPAVVSGFEQDVALRRAVERSSAKSFVCTGSPRSRWRPAPSSAWRRWCGGSTRTRAY